MDKNLEQFSLKSFEKGGMSGKSPQDIDVSKEFE